MTGSWTLLLLSCRLFFGIYSLLSILLHTNLANVYIKMFIDFCLCINNTINLCHPYSHHWEHVGNDRLLQYNINSLFWYNAYPNYHFMLTIWNMIEIIATGICPFITYTQKGLFCSVICYVQIFVRSQDSRFAIL